MSEAAFTAIIRLCDNAQTDESDPVRALRKRAFSANCRLLASPAEACVWRHLSPVASKIADAVRTLLQTVAATHVQRTTTASAMSAFVDQS